MTVSEDASHHNGMAYDKVLCKASTKGTFANINDQIFVYDDVGCQKNLVKSGPTDDTNE